MPKEKIISVAPRHIKPGIQKYGGTIDQHLQSLITNAGLTYTPYVFKDGRILLVLPYDSPAILYPDKETLYEVLNLEDHL